MLVHFTTQVEDPIWAKLEKTAKDFYAANEKPYKLYTEPTTTIQFEKMNEFRRLQKLADDRKEALGGTTMKSMIGEGLVEGFVYTHEGIKAMVAFNGRILAVDYDKCEVISVSVEYTVPQIEIEVPDILDLTDEQLTGESEEEPEDYDPETQVDEEYDSETQVGEQYDPTLRCASPQPEDVVQQVVEAAAEVKLEPETPTPGKLPKALQEQQAFMKDKGTVTEVDKTEEGGRERTDESLGDALAAFGDS